VNLRFRPILTPLLLFALLLSLTPPLGAAADKPLTKIDPELWQTMQRDGKASFFAVLAEQADTSAAAALAAKRDKGELVYQTLRATADRTQAGLRSYLASKGVRFEPYYIVNAVLIEAGQDVLLDVAARPEVSQLIPNRTFQAINPRITPTKAEAAPTTIEWNISFIHADAVWTQYGVDGTGAVIGDLDTGLDWTHPALKPHYRGWDGTTADHNYNWWDATTNGAQRVPYDDHGHGTHTMGTTSGYDPVADIHIGVAPGARTMACKNMDAFGSGQDAWFLSCFEFALAPWDLNHQNPRADMAPDVVNNSWGYWGGGVNTFYTAIQNLRNAGVFVEVSAGNEGSSCATLRSPADYDNVFTTGATADHSETLVWFSSRGPSDLYPSVIKPDIVAPGENINSSLPGGGYSGPTWSGTSMAGPHVVGTVALIVSANPGLRGQVATIEQLLRDTAYTGMPNPPNPDSCGGIMYNVVPNHIYGWGRLDALAAVSQVAHVGYLQGHVTDQTTGNPIPDATVSTNAGQSVTTDATGYYTMTLAAGTYDVTASKYLWSSQTVTGITIVEGATTTQDFALTPLPSYTVRGGVRNALTRLPAQATISFTGGPPPVHTDAQGRYSTSVAAGTYVITATPDSRCLNPASRTVTINTDLKLNFPLRPRVDGGGYSCDDTQPLTWIDATTPTGLTGDDSAVTLTLPFSFTYYGTTYTSVNVSTNGNIHFGPRSTAYSNTCLPTTSGPLAMIAPFWDDLYVDASAHVDQATTGTAPNRIFTIEWYNVRPYSNDGSRMTFEVQLYETTNNIQVIYNSLTGASAQGQSATAGIQNGSGTIATQYSCNEAALSTGLGIQYLP